MDLGPIGVWSSDVRTAERREAVEAARLVESLGFGTLWIPGRGDDVFERALDLLDATDRLVVATGIVSIWTVTPADAAAGFQRVAEPPPRPLPARPRRQPRPGRRRRRRGGTAVRSR